MVVANRGRGLEEAESGVEGNEEGGGVSKTGPRDWEAEGAGESDPLRGPVCDAISTLTCASWHRRKVASQQEEEQCALIP